MAELFFFLAAIGATVGAVGVIALRNPFYSVLALVFHLLSLAALFLLLRAEFVAAAQVIVYAGAVMVLYIFVVAYVGGGDEPLGSQGPALRVASTVVCGLLLVELCIAVLGSGLSALGEEGAGYEPGFGSAPQIGELLLTKFLAPFEIASYLLLMAAVGAVILARRRRGLDAAHDEEWTGPVSEPGRARQSGTLGSTESGTLEEAVGPTGI